MNIQLNLSIVINTAIRLILCFATAVCAQEKSPIKAPQKIAEGVIHTSDSLLNYLKLLPIEITQIVERCPWRSKQGKGVIRVAHISTELTQGLYLQWVEAATMIKPKRILATVKIKELEEKGGYRFDLPKARLTSSQCILTTKAIQVSNQRPHRIQIKVKGFGKYQIAIRPIFSDTSRAKN